jgi:hypothetical protein
MQEEVIKYYNVKDTNETSKKLIKTQYINFKAIRCHF